MARPKTLSAAFVKTVRDPGRYGDGRGSHGLSLLVKSTSTDRMSKTWSQRLRIDGGLVSIGLGMYPIVSLSEARAKALDNRRAVEQGRDPRVTVTGVPTFSQAADKVIALHAETWRDGGKSAKQWASSLNAYAMPTLGRRPVDAITTAHVLAVLMPIWNEKRETARRVRQRMSAVFQWAVAAGLRSDNPAGDAIGAALPRGGNGVKHHTALPHADVGDALAKVRESGAYLTTKLAMEFAVLTAARSGEVRGATWAEIDLEAATWTIPASRMKAGREHQVPLSAPALAVLEQASLLRDDSGLVFPSTRGREISDSTLSKLLRELGIAAVVHGFRSSFRDWAADTGQGRDVAEAALAHTVRDATEAAYFRSSLFERRRELMEAWSKYIKPPRIYNMSSRDMG